MCLVEYLEPVIAFHFCVGTRHAFYILMLTSFHRRESKKYLLCAIWTKSHALFHCLGLCSSVLKTLPLLHVLKRVDLPGEDCRTSSCPEKSCDCCTQVFTERNHRETEFMEMHVNDSLSFTVSLSNVCHSFPDDTNCSFVGTSLRKNAYIHLNLMKCFHVQY
jgi:hypothetical protein